VEVNRVLHAWRRKRARSTGERGPLRGSFAGARRRARCGNDNQTRLAFGRSGTKHKRGKKIIWSHVARALARPRAKSSFAREPNTQRSTHTNAPKARCSQHVPFGSFLSFCTTNSTSAFGPFEHCTIEALEHWSTGAMATLPAPLDQRAAALITSSCSTLEPSQPASSPSNWKDRNSNPADCCRPRLGPEASLWAQWPPHKGKVKWTSRAVYVDMGEP